MPDLLLICRDGLANSLVSNLVLAIGAKRAGVDVSVFFTQEALQALVDNRFETSPLLKKSIWIK